MPEPIETDGWLVSVRRGKHGGFVGHASHSATHRHLRTHEHRGRGSMPAARNDIMIQIRIDDILREDSDG